MASYWQRAGVRGCILISHVSIVFTQAGARDRLTDTYRMHLLQYNALVDMPIFTHVQCVTWRSRSR